MPIYEFKCEKCGEKVEKIFSMGKCPEKVECDKCGGEAKRQWMYGGNSFVGSGFHVNDYGRGN